MRQIYPHTIKLVTFVEEHVIRYEIQNDSIVNRISKIQNVFEHFTPHLFSMKIENDHLTYSC